MTSFKPTLPIEEIKLYQDYSLSPYEVNILQTFASSNYPGFSPNLAFDNFSETYWIPQEWGKHEAERDYIGAILNSSNRINAVEIKFKEMDNIELPKGFYVESSDFLEKDYYRRWQFHLHTDHPNGIYVKPSCKPMYRTYETSKSTRCYRIIWENVTWFEAENDCQSRNATLLSVHGKKDLDFIRLDPFQKIPFWSGLNAIYSNSSFQWSDGTPNDFIKLNHLETNGNDDEKCVYIDENDAFKKANCNEKKIYICTKPSEPFEFTGFEKKDMKLSPEVKFTSKDFYTPILASKYEKPYDPIEEPIVWPEYARIPLVTNENVTYYDRVEKLQPLILGTFTNFNPLNKLGGNSTANDSAEEKR